MPARGTRVEGASAALNTPGQRGQPRWSTQDGPATISEHGASPAPPTTTTGVQKTGQNPLLWTSPTHYIQLGGENQEGLGMMCWTRAL